MERRRAEYTYKSYNGFNLRKKSIRPLNLSNLKSYRNTGASKGTPREHGAPELSKLHAGGGGGGAQHMIQSDGDREYLP